MNDKTTTEVLGLNDENEKEFWTNDRFNLALELLLVGVPWQRIAERVGVPKWKSVETALRKLAKNYGGHPDDKRDAAMVRYSLLPWRTNRTGLKANEWDIWIMDTAMGEDGKLRGADNAEWIASLLSRGVDEVVELLKPRHKGKGFGFAP